MISPLERIKEFVARGNIFRGILPNHADRLDIQWTGSGSILEIGTSVKFLGVKLSFANNGAIELGNNTTLKGRIDVSPNGSVSIGKNTILNRPCDIRSGEGADVSVGEGCLFSNVKIYTSDMHSLISCDTGQRTNPAASVVIEDNVWIAEDVKIAKGVRVGTGSTVASGSLVTKSIPPLCLAAGRPSRIIRRGVRWSRELLPIPPLPCPEFDAADIPLDRIVLKGIIQRKQYHLAEQVILLHGTEPLPLFAKWYLLLSQHMLKRTPANAVDILDCIIAEMPNHKSAKMLRSTLKRATSPE